MWEPYKARREEHGVQLYGALGIDRNDAAARLRNTSATSNSSTRRRRFSSPSTASSAPVNGPISAVIIHALMFLARGHGLDTCPQESWARMHRIVGPFVDMPPEQMLFCAVAIGYGDPGHPANSFRSPRAPAADFVPFWALIELTAAGAGSGEGHRIYALASI